MGRKTISYRGSLKSCNYRCSYCPFSKHRASLPELERDREDFERFCRSIETRAEELDVGAVFVVPYGEASIHRWYWEGLGRLSAVPGMDRVGLQTNLSFSVEECLKIFDFYGGIRAPGNGGENRLREKLCLWATFHPEMTDTDVFADKCRRLAGSGVSLCAGAVGVPRNIPVLARLREALPSDVYLWINRMDGLGRNYTDEEKAAFSGLDPFFEMELKSPAADAGMCRDRCFVEAGGRIRACNISGPKEADWYKDGAEDIFRPVCGKKRCTCYLAYGGRADFEGRQFFGSYPVFRIPRKRKAVFLDLDGTLIPEGKQVGLSEDVRRKLEALREKCPVFLATSMPEEAVRKRLGKDVELFRGAVFASGAYLRLGMGAGEEYCREDGCTEEARFAEGCRQAVYPVDLAPLPRLRKFAEFVDAGIRLYRKNNVVYKITIIKKRRSVWKEEERRSVRKLLEGADCRAFVERHCLQIIGKGLDKGSGVREICGWLGILPEEAAAWGNDEEDKAMKRVCRL